MKLDPSKLTPEQKKQAEKLKDDVKKYHGKSEKELLSELEKMKKSGMLTQQKLEMFKRKVLPMWDLL